MHKYAYIYIILLLAMMHIYAYINIILLLAIMHIYYLATCSGEHVTYHLQRCTCIILQLAVMHMYPLATWSDARVLAYYCSDIRESCYYFSEWTCSIHFLCCTCMYLCIICTTTICSDAHVSSYFLQWCTCMYSPTTLFNAHALQLAVIHMYSLTTCRDAQSFSNYLQWCTCARFLFNSFVHFCTDFTQSPIVIWTLCRPPWATQ